ncbi:phosphatidylinositol mannoside acyltransferase [Corynebacterium choanae]|uniref:Phosphatidylinositol mannoside acyltransferase n=1 Tax=Corynebacterium choanae TaxID=1862358 RepID=A0A3G6J6I2_9CORY|nr:phosphatidylinositol mannoside acyltransferase [Corynebacterium choanae]AZA13711.1 Phosphatidylinositol mannoside acyltransferase [Corynebacterium choanae]
MVKVSKACRVQSAVARMRNNLLVQAVASRDVAAIGYIAAWQVVKFLPDRLIAVLPGIIGRIVSQNGRGMEQLRRNLTRVVGPEAVTTSLVIASTASYVRYWLEAFRLRELVHTPGLLKRLDASVTGFAHVQESIAADRPVLLVTTHSGNWDLAGWWLTTKLGSFTTVAERLRPEVLFSAFVNYRETLGFEVIASRGDGPVVPQLISRLNNRQPVVLLGERDLSRHGVEVPLCGELAKLPYGPEKLARATDCAVHVADLWFTDNGWRFAVSEDLNPVSEQGRSAVQAMPVGGLIARLADRFTQHITAHPADWHMLQPVFVADLEQR